MAKKWISIWKMPHVKKGLIPTNYSHRTCRLVVKSNLSGDALRIKLNNESGTSYVRLDAASACVCDKYGTFTGVPVKLTFEDKPKAILSAGKTLVSDDVKLDIPQGSYIAISLYFNSRASVVSGNVVSEKFLVSKTGDFTMQDTMNCDSTLLKAVGAVKRIAFSASSAEALNPCGLISEVQVFNSERINTSCVVLLGDSTAKKSGFVDYLRAAFEGKYPGRYQLIDSTINSNRLIYDGGKNKGESGSTRLEKDALNALGVSAVILMLGANDIALPGTNGVPVKEAVIAQQLVNTYKEMINKAREKGVKVYGMTIPPICDSAAYSEELENRRQNVNNWFREKGSKRFDGVIDIASVLEDSAVPGQKNKAYYTDKGEINVAGAKAMVECINFKKFF